MYILTTPNKDLILTGDTLEELREKLVDYHEENRSDPQYGDYLDQFEAVYPLDESELDDDETPLVPRELTSEILEGMASMVWDVPTVFLREEDGTDIHRLADTLHYMLDMDEDAALDILRGYITEIEDIDGREIDEDEINEQDADFLIGAVKSARAAGDLGQKEIFALEDAATDYQNAADTAESLRQVRDTAIRAALAAGATQSQVARAAGISRQAISKMGR
nr:MAG TPA: KorB domain [Caudoviricetes sp.]